MSVEVRDLVEGIAPPRAAAKADVLRHLDELTKPPGSLGRLEALALRLARIYGDPPPSLRRRTILVLAADHGVAARGVSAYPSDVTAQMCRNFAAGGAAICAIGRAVDAEVVAVDVGVACPAEAVHVLSRRVAPGTADLSVGPAMSREQAVAAMRAGAELVRERCAATDVFALGEMGIGNSTAAAALTGALTRADVGDVVGPGTGVDLRRLAHKRSLVAAAVARIAPDAAPLEILAELGGFEIAALAGATLEAARSGRAVVTDGFIATAAVLVAARFAPAVVDYVIASHRSREPGHTVQLRELGLEPLLDLDLRLGEGTGAALALPLLEGAAALLRDMATFAAAGVSGATGGGDA